MKSSPPNTCYNCTYVVVRCFVFQLLFVPPRLIVECFIRTDDHRYYYYSRKRRIVNSLNEPQDSMHYDMPILYSSVPSYPYVAIHSQHSDMFRRYYKRFVLLHLRARNAVNISRTLISKQARLSRFDVAGTETSINVCCTPYPALPRT